MKILIAVDGSNYSRMALEFITSRQTLIKRGCAVQVLHVRPQLPGNLARALGSAKVRAYYAEEAEKILKLRVHACERSA